MRKFLPQIIATFLSKIVRTLSIRRRRMMIGMARDTSYRIYARYAPDQRFGRDYVTVVFDPYNEPHFRGRVWSPLNRVVEMLLPDRLCYVPHQKSYQKTGFKELGAKDLRGFGWEEYVWQGKAFGTHIRGSKTRKRNKSEDNELDLIKKNLDTFVAM